MTDNEDVGSLGEEMLKLLSALGAGNPEEVGQCPHGWCPVCRLVEYVQSSPELMDDAGEALMKVTAGLMELIKAIHPDMSHE